MISIIPFTPSVANETITVALEDVRYLIATRWNSRENAFYMDLRYDNGDPILLGIKIVLGVNLGRRSAHPFFTKYLMFAADASGLNRDPGLDDLNRRVAVYLMTEQDVADLANGVTSS